MSESDPHPKKELTSTPLVLSSTGVHSSASVSGMSADAFLAAKKEWKKTNLEEEKEKMTDVLALLQGLASHCPHLARSMTRSSCLFT